MSKKIKPSIIIRYHPKEIIITDFSKPGIDWVIIENTRPVRDFLQKAQDNSIQIDDSSLENNEIMNLIDYFHENDMLENLGGF